ncbi:MAG: transcriptional regulator, partial [Thermoleophilia bacterium]|nr:transcriptional regulator [Thermoleophilia bacterium]
QVKTKVREVMGKTEPAEPSAPKLSIVELPAAEPAAKKATKSSANGSAPAKPKPRAKPKPAPKQRAT